MKWIAILMSFSCDEDQIKEYKLNAPNIVSTQRNAMHYTASFSLHFRVINYLDILNMCPLKRNISLSSFK